MLISMKIKKNQHFLGSDKPRMLFFLLINVSKFLKRLKCFSQGVTEVYISKNDAFPESSIQTVLYDMAHIGSSVTNEITFNKCPISVMKVCRSVSEKCRIKRMMQFQEVSYYLKTLFHLWLRMHATSTTNEIV